MPVVVETLCLACVNVKLHLHPMLSSARLDSVFVRNSDSKHYDYDVTVTRTTKSISVKAYHSKHNAI